MICRRGFALSFNRGYPIKAEMNKTGIVLVLAVCGYFGYRHLASARAIQRLSEVPANATGAGGFSRLSPTEPLVNYLEPGRHNVFIFSATWCPACQALEAQLPRFVQQRPDVAIHSIDIHDWGTASQIAQACGIKIRSIPHVVIFDSEGQIAAQDDGGDKSGYEALVRWVNKELQRPTP